jgi:hypothetical protein
MISIHAMVIAADRGASLPGPAIGLLASMFIFGHAFGPGAQGVTMATLPFPPRIRGIGAGTVPQSSCSRGR